MLAALKVAKCGYYGGDLAAALHARVDHVVAVLRYETFLSEYETAYRNLNRPSSS